VARFALSVISYAAGTPGGIFAPMLVIGSHIGLLVGLIAQAIAPSYAPEPAALALIGMAAFGACAIAMLVAMMLRSEPIYDALTTRAANAAKQNADEATTGGSDLP